MPTLTKSFSSTAKEIDGKKIDGLFHHLQKKIKSKFQLKEEIMPDCGESIDMVFMFADPLVVDYNGKMIEYIVPLDLDTEYANICKNLYLTGKEFRIQRRALTIETLSDVIT